MSNKLGFQSQAGGAVALSMVRAAPPGVLKLLNQALDNGGVKLAAEWRKAVGPDGLLVYRRVYPPGSDLSQMPARTRETLGDATRLLASGPVAVESPFNEELANGPGLADLCEAEVAFVDTATSSGFDAVVMVLPEGNPANPQDVAQPRVVAALRKMKAVSHGRRVYFGWHGYTTPTLGPHDPDHLLRYRTLLALLPEDVRFPVLMGETGIDGGIEGKKAWGWRAYGLAPKRYADDVLRPLRDEITNDDRIAGAAVFGCSMNADWSSFDVRDELDLRGVFAAPAPLWKPGRTTMLNGLDVSNWQADVDWRAVAGAGYAFAIAKATEGADFTDRYFGQNWRGMAAAGLMRGAYLFARPDRASPAAHVALFQQTVAAAGGLGQGDQVALDLEDGSGDLLVWAAECLDLLERSLGVTPFLYTGHWFAGPHDLEGHAPSLGKYPLWWASYSADEPEPPTGWDRITIWQNSASANVPGTAGAVDTDVFRGTADELRALGHPALPAPPPPQPDPVTDALNNVFSLTLECAACVPDARRRDAQAAVQAIKVALGRG